MNIIFGNKCGIQGYDPHTATTSTNEENHGTHFRTKLLSSGDSLSPSLVQVPSEAATRYVLCQKMFLEI